MHPRERVCNHVVPCLRWRTRTTVHCAHVKKCTWWRGLLVPRVCVRNPWRNRCTPFRCIRVSDFGDATRECDALMLLLVIVLDIHCRAVYGGKTPTAKPPSPPAQYRPSSVFAGAHAARTPLSSRESSPTEPQGGSCQAVRHALQRAALARSYVTPSLTEQGTVRCAAAHRVQTASMKCTVANPRTPTPTRLAAQPCLNLILV